MRVAPRVSLPGERRPRVQRTYTPNPRLYPGPKAKPTPTPTPRPKRADGQRRQHKRVFRRPVPNARLYRPAPVRPEPPPRWPRVAWSPPAPARALDSASCAALHLSERRRPELERAPPAPQPAPTGPLSRRLVVTLPGAAKAGGDAAPVRYRPASAHFRLRELGGRSGSSSPPAARPPSAMDTADRHAASAEDRSDADDTPPSAPSEFLAEFLSAIMQRQYAEALKYCRLILQYEPHNATARGFYPLLRHKLHAHERDDAARSRGSSSEEASGAARAPPPPRASRPLHEAMEQEADESVSESRSASGRVSRLDSQGSCASQSSLELDESDVCAGSSPSLSLSRRTATDHTDSASAGCWESTGSASRSDADDNGNAPAARPPMPGDVENDNAALGEPLQAAHLASESASSLQRLRAQFACSIK